MLIVDLSNLAFGVLADYHRTTGEQIDMGITRHLLIGKLKTVKDKLKAFSDEIVIAADSRRGYWRKDIFKHYKAHRSKDKEGDTLDWGKLFECFDTFKQELKDFFPVKYVEVDGAEADDIMAVLAQRYASHLKVCIFSSDKDLLQIQEKIDARVKQFSMAKNNFITCENSDYSLFEHVCRGDDGDGVPNILSDEDTFVTEGKRQKPMYAKKLAEWRKSGIHKPEEFCDSSAMLERFNRNRQLIDMTMIPEEIQMQIVDAYEAAVPNRGKMFDYLAGNKLNSILKNGGF